MLIRKSLCDKALTKYRPIIARDSMGVFFYHNYININGNDKFFMGFSLEYDQIQEKNIETKDPKLGGSHHIDKK